MAGRLFQEPPVAGHGLEDPVRASRPEKAVPPAFLATQAPHRADRSWKEGLSRQARPQERRTRLPFPDCCDYRQIRSASRRQLLPLRRCPPASNRRLARLRRKKDQLHESWASGLGLLYSWLGIRCLRHSFRFYNFSRSMNFENFLRMPKNAKTTARLPFQHRNFGRENRRRHGLRMPVDVRVLCFTAPAHTPLTTQLVFWEGEAFPEPPAFWFVLVCAGPSGKAKKSPVSPERKPG